MKVVFATPAYNEAANLPQVLGRIRDVMAESGRDYAVVVCDDGSTDGTADVLAEAAADQPVTVVTHPVNQGYGAAMRDAINAAARLAGRGDVVVTLDADATQDPAYAADMIAAIEAGADVVVASRYAAGSTQRGTSPLRRLLSRGAGSLLTVVFPTRGVRDFSSGFRAIEGGFLARAIEAHGGALVEERGFAATPELLLKLRAAGARFAEVPFTLRYDVKQGESKIRIWRTIGQYLVLIARMRLRPPAGGGAEAGETRMTGRGRS